jgi:hypothetical protein
MIWEDIRTAPMTNAEARRILIVLGHNVPEDYQIFAAKLAILGYYDPQQLREMKATLAGGMLLATALDMFIAVLTGVKKPTIPASPVAASAEGAAARARGLSVASPEDLRAAGFQEHHIISNKNPLTQDHELLKLSGFDLQSRANKMWLPKDPSVYAGRSLHSGKHWKSVSQNLKAQMDAVVQVGKANGWTREQFREALLAILREERALLRSGERALNSVARPGAR